jgi:hypothetical protein
VRRRPSRFGYGLGGAIVLLAVAGGVALLVASLRVGGKVADYQRVPIPGRGEVSLEAGEQVIFLEPNEDGHAAPSEPVTVVVASSATGRALRLSPYFGSFTYDFGGHSGRAYRTFRADAPGRYVVVTEASQSSQATDVAIGPPFGRRFATLLVAGIMLLIAGSLVGLVIVVVTAILRYVRHPDRQRAGGAVGGAGTSPVGAAGAAPARTGTAAAGWYADPWAQARLRYWDGASWTEHTAA